MMTSPFFLSPPIAERRLAPNELPVAIQADWPNPDFKVFQLRSAGVVLVDHKPKVRDNRGGGRAHPPSSLTMADLCLVYLHSAQHHRAQFQEKPQNRIHL